MRAERGHAPVLNSVLCTFQLFPRDAIALSAIACLSLVLFVERMVCGINLYVQLSAEGFFLLYWN